MSVIKRPQESLDRGLFNHLTSRTAGAASRVAAVAGPVLLVPPHRRGHAKARSVHLRSLPGRVAGQQTAKAGASVEESTAAINQWQQPQRRQDTTHGCQTKHCKAPCAAQVDPCVEELRHRWQQSLTSSQGVTRLLDDHVKTGREPRRDRCKLCGWDKTEERNSRSPGTSQPSPHNSHSC